MMKRLALCANALLLSFALAACAGGGSDSGGSPGASAPLPPGDATPVHTVVDASVTGYSAAEAAGTGSNSDPALVASGGSTPTVFESPDDTAFPLVQTAISFSPTGAEANSDVNAAGASLTYVSSAVGEHSLLTIGGVDDYPLELTGGDPATGTAELDGTAGSNASSVDARLLQWTTYGMWSVTTPDFTSGTIGYFTSGIQTPSGSLPTMGTGNYSGSTTGTAFNASGTYDIAGDLDMTVDWASSTLTGTLGNMTATNGGSSTAWNTVEFTGGLSGSAFSGTTSVTGAAGGPAGLGGTATGDVTGQIYGPFADEAGGVWTISDGNTIAAGAFGGH